MNKSILFFLSGAGLILGLLIAGRWAYWHERPPRDAWTIEKPKQIVTATAGQQLDVKFLLRNVSSNPRRILGVEAC